ncbi:CLUMA_CG014331, isoform A [Clunio marinus]|uniref:CLUMA_CG014331, isoform A n=1 Tax=Clunio marinus TaxID=568069 RepID=A0A1J1IL41_9DIPT|nr:CLUMA_CG014331, isoform A [Clunio marinus]
MFHQVHKDQIHIEVCSLLVMLPMCC